MRRSPILFTAVCAVLCAVPGAGAQEVAPADPDSLARWQEMRFGLFIHWGPVSIRGTEIGWSRGAKVPAAEYDQLYKQFNPERFDAREWVALAKDAGMRYVIITSKHHDGFCIWDSALTDYDILSTPFKRDILRELSDACREAGLAFSTYHSILDWYQPDYNTNGAQGGPGYALLDGQKPDMDRYVAYMKGQLREIVTKYGPLQIMWFDGEWEDPWNAERGWDLYRFCRELDPKMLVNNRVGKGRQGMEGVTKAGFAPGDYDTPEQEVGAFNLDRPWETCMTICTQWAWKPDDRLKSLKEVVDILVQTAGGGGNLLLNVGPMPDGRIEPRQADRLRELGAWLAKNGDSIYGTTGGPFRPEKWGCSTSRGDTVYVHVLKRPGNRLSLPKGVVKVQSAALMDGTPVPVKEKGDELVLDLKGAPDDPLDLIVVLKAAPKP
ncbi:MAG TPA: alpha-L-fucosidase [Candidatus Hydrogenedentes bacterium]|nr:alpha-L-fucosidase [Candidatus Hydrogenedentota bacterium]